MLVNILLLCALLGPSAAAKCSICSLFSDYYDDTPSVRRLETKLADSGENYRGPLTENSEQHMMTTVGKFSDLTSSLFGNLFGLLSERAAHITSDDGSSPLRGRGRTAPGVEKQGPEPKQKVTTQLFDIFDSIGSGILQMSRLDGPHVCTRESTTRWPADGKLLSSEKSCQRFRDANKCVDRRSDSNITVETIRVEECCEGYETKDIFRLGCPTESKPVTVQDALNSLNSSLWDIAKDNKLVDELNKKNVTIFVSPESENKVPDSKSYVLNRIVPGVYRPYDWKDGALLKTAGGGELVISQSEDAFGSVRSYVNCVPLNSTTIRTEGGIVHVASGDLAPAAEHVLAALKDDPRFALFVSMLSDDLREMLSSNDSFTVFAPSDKVLASLSKSLLADIKEGRGCASDFVRSHVVRGSFCTSQLSYRRLSTLTGGQLEARTQIKKSERVTHVGRARITGTEEFAKNGVVHAIDDVLFSDELMSWKEHLAVYNKELAETMEEVVKNSTEPITIFVPPTENNKTLSTEAARNHMVLGEVVEDLQRSSTITTKAGSVMFTGFAGHSSPIWMRISVNPQSRQRGQVACSRVTQESVKGCRAILQFIDKPLPIIQDSLETFLAKRSDLSKFYSLYRESALNVTLSKGKPLTAFVPSDDAFSNNSFKKLASNRKSLESFVRRHLIEEPLCSFDLRHNPGEIRIRTYLNLNGEGLRPTQAEGETYIEGSKVEEAEIVLSNAVAYVIDSIIVRNGAITQPESNRRRNTNLLEIIR